MPTDVVIDADLQLAIDHKNNLIALFTPVDYCAALVINLHFHMIRHCFVELCFEFFFVLLAGHGSHDNVRFEVVHFLEQLDFKISPCIVVFVSVLLH